MQTLGDASPPEGPHDTEESTVYLTLDTLLSNAATVRAQSQRHWGKTAVTETQCDWQTNS